MSNIKIRLLDVNDLAQQLQNVNANRSRQACMDIVCLPAHVFSDKYKDIFHCTVQTVKDFQTLRVVQPSNMNLVLKNLSNITEKKVIQAIRKDYFKS